ncbi:AMP-binding protein [Mycolicibacterium flavescens]|uniref:Cyclohexanecarboxylate-CoA ligase n=1 Tax=Mycolicibacterium flavescens TaxID=1776 RepID=A0A1E3RDJ8_MYCFV|nr:AMP-binding protein [Mycolicibacterium flavescens]MCV7282430.1 AMP-binding protein [Mycolicibacterium flavescens]ODQ87948.1 cyclohexanecarboxylate-CoA ligase [Mycolicibacterium flavescens]
MHPGYERLRERWYRGGWYSGRTLIDAIEHGADEHGAAELVFAADGTETVVSLADLHRRATAVAAALQARGIGPGDTVAVQMTNRIECAVVYQAVLLCGAVLVPIVHIYGRAEVDFILAQSAAKLMITLDTVPAPSEAAYRRPEPSADDVAVLIYTSGTTSAPKGVQHSHNSMLAELVTLSAVIAGDDASVQLATFPPGHIAGVNAMLRPMTSGRRSVFLERWDPATAAELIQRHRITSTAGTPFHLEGLLALPGADRKLATLREYLTGAAAVSEELGQRAREAGIESFRCYGCTEHPTVTSGRADEPEAARFGTDGAPLPGSAVRILAPSGDEQPVGVDGEVVVQGPDQFIGYRDPALDADAFTADGWFRTGDLGHLDRDGRLTITDRIKDVIIRGGETISSGQVEDVLNTHPAVAEGAVVAAPDPRYGDVVAAIVVLNPGTTLEIEDLRTHFAAAGLAKQKTPERLVVVDALPRTALGKVRKADLRKEHFG